MRMLVNIRLFSGILIPNVKVLKSLPGGFKVQKCLEYWGQFLYSLKQEEEII